MKEDLGAIHTEKDWDTSEADVKNVMRGEFPDHVIRTEKCLRLLAKDSIQVSEIDKICAYAKVHDVNETKILLMYGASVNEMTTV